MKLYDENARAHLAKNPRSLRLSRNEGGEFTWQILDGDRVMAEGKNKTMADREAEITKFEAGKQKRENIDVSLVHFTSKNNYVEAGGRNSGAAQFIERLPAMNSRDLLKVVEGTVNAERVTFVMRGAAAFELVKRKLREVEKFTKVKGQGIDTICNTLAKEVGIDGKTLYKDYRIFEEFGDRLKALLVDTPERILPRELYAVAVCANSELTTPAAVLDYFEEQREATGGYFTDHARRDIKRINEGLTIDEIREMDGLERIEKVNEKKERMPDGDKTTSLKIVASVEANYYMRQIIDKHASFSTWFLTRAKEEFGNLPKGKS